MSAVLLITPRSAFLPASESEHAVIPGMTRVVPPGTTAGRPSQPPVSRRPPLQSTFIPLTGGPPAAQRSALGALEVADERSGGGSVGGVGRGGGPLAGQRPARLVAWRPAGLGAAAQLQAVAERGGEVVARPVTVRGQQGEPAVGAGCGGDAAEVERADVNVGDYQVPAGPQHAGELGHHRAEGG